MVGFHVIDDNVVDRTVTYHFMNVFQTLRKEIHLNGINQTHQIVVYQVRII